MTELHGIRSPGIVPVDGGLEARLDDNIRQVMSDIQHLSGLEHAERLEQVTVIQHLGNAAYHLALARRLLQASETPTEPAIAESTVTVLRGPVMANMQPPQVPDGSNGSEAEIPSIQDVQAETSSTTSSHESESQTADPIPEAQSSDQPHSEELDDEQSSKQRIVDNIGKALGLSPRMQAMTFRILTSVKPGQWFRRAEVDMSGIDFPSPEAFKGAFVDLAKKLTSNQILEHNGKEKYGRLYRLAAESPYLSARPVVIESKEGQPTSQPPRLPEHIGATAISPLVRATQDVVQSTVGEAPVAELAEPLKALITDEELAARLKSHVTTLYENSRRTTVRLSRIAKHIANEEGISEKEARELIATHLIDAGTHQIETSAGSQFLTMSGEQKPTRIAPEVVTDPNAWTQTHADISYNLLARLLTANIGKEEIPFHDLVSQVQNGYDPRVVRKTLAILVDNGYISILESKSHTGAIRQDNRVVRLENEALIKKLIEDRQSVRHELLNLASTSN